MSSTEETEKKITHHLEEWLSVTQNTEINKNIQGFIESAKSALNILANTRVAAFIYDYERGNYAYFNSYFPELMNTTSERIEEIGIRIMQESVHPEDFIKCLSITRRSLAVFDLMKDDEKESTQLRLFFRIKRASGEYFWVMQSNRQVRWSKYAPTLDLAYIVELFNDHHPMKVMAVLQTNSRNMNIFPDDDTVLLSKLTMREMEVLRLASMGLSTKNIADKLVVSENTIKTHRHNLIKKLKVRNIVQASSMLEKIVN